MAPVRANFSDVVLLFVSKPPERTRDEISVAVARWGAVVQLAPTNLAAALALLRAHREGAFEITTSGVAKRAGEALNHAQDEGLIEQSDGLTLHVTAAGQARLRERGLLK